MTESLYKIIWKYILNVEQKIETRLQGGMFRSNEIPLENDSSTSHNEWNHNFNLYNLFDDHILIFLHLFIRNIVLPILYCLKYGIVNILHMVNIQVILKEDVAARTPLKKRKCVGGSTKKIRVAVIESLYYIYWKRFACQQHLHLHNK